MTAAPEGDLHAEIAGLLAQVIEVPAEEITPQSRIAEDLGVDSLSLLELIIGIEEHLGVVIPDGEVNGLQRIADVTAYVARASV